MAPIVHGLEAEYGDRINFVYVNVADPATKDLRAALKRRSQPEFFLLDEQGQVLARWFGEHPAEVFEEAFAMVLAE